MGQVNLYKIDSTKEKSFLENLKAKFEYEGEVINTKGKL